MTFDQVVERLRAMWEMKDGESDAGPKMLKNLAAASQVRVSASKHYKPRLTTHGATTLRKLGQVLARIEADDFDDAVDRLRALHDLRNGRSTAAAKSTIAALEDANQVWIGAAHPNKGKPRLSTHGSETMRLFERVIARLERDHWLEDDDPPATGSKPKRKPVATKDAPRICTLPDW